MLRTSLLVSGILASVLYVATDIVAATRYAGYSYTGQAVSELFAIGAPTRSFVVSLFFVHGLCQLGFGFGVWLAAGSRRGLRATAGLLISIGMIDLAACFFPMHSRGGETTFTDTMHVVLAAVTVILILLAIAFSATALGRWFRSYSIATIALLLLGGGLAFGDAARVAANLPTPWLGVTEQINIYGYMLWMLVLALALTARQPDWFGAPGQTPLRSRQA